jgi:hypothetical protein
MNRRKPIIIKIQPWKSSSHPSYIHGGVNEKRQEPVNFCTLTCRQNTTEDNCGEKSSEEAIILGLFHCESSWRCLGFILFGSVFLREPCWLASDLVILAANYCANLLGNKEAQERVCQSLGPRHLKVHMHWLGPMFPMQHFRILHCKCPGTGCQIPH